MSDARPSGVICAFCASVMAGDATVCLGCHAYQAKKGWRRAQDDVVAIRQHLQSIAGIMSAVFLLWLIGGVIFAWLFVSSITSTKGAPTSTFQCRPDAIAGSC